MNRPAAREGCSAASRAASVSSRAARWPDDILEVSISESGSTAGAGLVSTGAGLVSIIGPSLSWIKFLAAGGHGSQQPAWVEMGGAALHEPVHLTDQSREAEVFGVTQRPAAERREAGAHDHREIHVGRVANDFLLQATHGFIDHQQHHALA